MQKMHMPFVMLGCAQGLHALLSEKVGCVVFRKHNIVRCMNNCHSFVCSMK